MDAQLAQQILHARFHQLKRDVVHTRDFVHEQRRLGNITQSEFESVISSFLHIVSRTSGFDLADIKCDHLSYGLISHGLDAMKKHMLRINPDWRAELYNRDAEVAR